VGPGGGRREKERRGARVGKGTAHFCKEIAAAEPEMKLDL